MIKIEYLHEGTLIMHYSDKNVMLLQNETGAEYDHPIDVVPCRYTYSETNKPIEDDFSDEEFRAMVEEAVE